MRNVLAIAGKELRGYFASPIAYVLIGFFALLFGWFFYVPLAFFNAACRCMQMGMGPQTHEHQPDADRPAAHERHGDHAVPAAADHDADLRRGEALRHHRAAAHLADHRRQIILGKFLGAMGCSTRRCSR